MINLTVQPRASEELQKALQGFDTDTEVGPVGVRVFVGSQCGCGTAHFQMGFDEPREGDNQLSVNGVTILVDPDTAPFLEGAELDYSDDLMGKGFLINAPQASGGGCGCGGHGHHHH